MTDFYKILPSTCDFGKATAVKRGRNDIWPYVPVIVYKTHTHQIPGLAFKTRELAIAAAKDYIQSQKDRMLQNLNDPCCRALREAFGLPRELLT